MFFAKDVDAHVRACVAKTICSSRNLLSLSKDNDKHVRITVMQNTSTPKEILLMLSKDDVKSVRVTAKQNKSYK